MNLFLEILKGKKFDQNAIWIMRQAGRYLPEYLELRKNFSSFMDFCLTPKAAADATIMPISRFNFDAAIIFSDILVLPYALGVEINFIEGIGPVLKKIQSIKCLKKAENIILSKVYDAISITRERINQKFPNKSLIGFAGAPWTVACYLIEGKGSKDFSDTRKFAYTNKKDFSEIILRITEETIKHLANQIKAGAQVVKIFDSWAGLLPYDLFLKFVVEPTKNIVRALKSEFKDVPIIGFAKGSGTMNCIYAEDTEIDCLALDQTIDINWAKKNISDKVAIQGNLDNALLFASKDDIDDAATKILQTFSDRRFIFNLGHGILPKTPLENVQHLINKVKNFKNESNS